MTSRPTGYTSLELKVRPENGSVDCVCRGVACSALLSPRGSCRSRRLRLTSFFPSRVPQADLYKESKTFRGRTWTTRYFLLSGQWLFYYKSQSSYSKGDPPHKALDVADTWIMEKGIVKSGSKVSEIVERKLHSEQESCPVEVIRERYIALRTAWRCLGALHFPESLRLPVKPCVDAHLRGICAPRGQ